MTYLEPAVWYQQLATFHGAASALITDPRGRILHGQAELPRRLVLPGGVLEADERPETCCAREVLEEVGLTVRPGRLLVLDWVPADDGRPRPFVSFLFDCGTVAAGTPIRLQTEELDEYRFVEPGGGGRPAPRLGVGRLTAARRGPAHGGTTVYLPMHAKLTGG